MKRLTFMDCFAGIGGFRMALEQLGIVCVASCEIDKHARKAYKAIYGGEEPFYGDIKDIDPRELPDFDLLTGGFPCQAFSVAGKRRGFEDARGTLFFEIARIAKEKRPKAILLENVKGLVNHRKGETLDIIIRILNEIGYVIDFEVLNSKYFGVPQNRERIFIVALRNDIIEAEPFNEESMVGNTIVPRRKRAINEWAHTFNFDWPEQTEITTRLRDILESDVDERYYLNEEKTARLVAQLESNVVENSILDTKPKDAFRIYAGESPTLQANDYKEPKKVIEPQMLGHIDMKGHDAIKRVYSAYGVSLTLTTMGGGHREPKIAVEQFTKGGGISCCIDANYTKGIAPRNVGKGRRTHVVEEIRPVLTPDRLEKRQNGRRFKDNDEEAFTLTAQDRHGVAIGEKPCYRIRKLTPLECWRLQGFPDWAFDRAKSAGMSDTQLYKQAGNAVTVNVVYEIGKRLVRYVFRR